MILRSYGTHPLVFKNKSLKVWGMPAGTFLTVSQTLKQCKLQNISHSQSEICCKG